MSKSLHVKTIERILPVTVLLAVIMIALLTLYPFLPAILWGGMLAIAVEPRYQWLVRKLDGRRGRAAWLTGIILALLLYRRWHSRLDHLGRADIHPLAGSDWPRADLAAHVTLALGLGPATHGVVRVSLGPGGGQPDG
jgi:hypothetical protein